MQVKTILTLVLSLAAGLASPAEPPAMTDAQKVATWTGERVMLVGRPFDKVNYHPYLKPRGKSSSLRYADYVGKTGVVTEATAAPELKMVVRLDGSGEELEVRSPADGDVFFLAELEAARKAMAALADRPVWTKARMTLDGPETEESRRNNTSTGFPVPPLTKLAAKGADTRQDSYQPLRLSFRLEDGREGTLSMGGQSGACLEPRLHLSIYGGACRKPWTAEAAFYLAAPETLFPGWSPDVWKLVRKGEVAIGMTEAMARVACGGALLEAGGVLSDDGKLAPIYWCYEKKFLVRGGKVAKYVE